MKNNIKILIKLILLYNKNYNNNLYSYNMNLIKKNKIDKILYF